MWRGKCLVEAAAPPAACFRRDRFWRGWGLAAMRGRRPALLDERRVQAPIERLVPVSCAGCPASTSGLSTWWATTALGRDLVLRRVSRLDAFSGYPVRT